MTRRTHTPSSSKIPVNGKTATLASVTLVSGNAATGSIDLGAPDESVKYLKIEAATAGVNTDSLAHGVERPPAALPARRTAADGLMRGTHFLRQKRRDSPSRAAFRQEILKKRLHWRKSGVLYGDFTAINFEDRAAMLTVLMYHRILPEEHPDAISAAVFDRQLDYLTRRYRMLTPDEVFLYVRGELHEKRPCAALSFDDGWLDNLLFATPVLQKYGLCAMLAVSAGYLHDGAARDRENDEILYLRNREAQQRAASGDLRSYLNRAELRIMHDSGVWSLEAHGSRHVKGVGGASVLALPQPGESREDFRQRLRRDILNSCDAVTAVAGRRPRMFFWPWGHYTAMAAETVRDSGLIQFTVAKGSIRPNDGRTVLPRVGASPRRIKFRKNCMVFRSPLLTGIHDLFHKEKVCFDDFPVKENQ